MTMKRGKNDPSRSRSSLAERFAALGQVGKTLMGEVNESRLLSVIVQSACDIVGAQYAAFTLRPTDDEGYFTSPAQGSNFYLASAIGMTIENGEALAHTPLGDKGVLAPIFQRGESVLIADLAANTERSARGEMKGRRPEKRTHIPPDPVPLPSDHPPIRSFLGAPLLNRDSEVMGGLLLGSLHPDQFTTEDEALLVGLATQAAVSLENARLYRLVQKRAQEVQRYARIEEQLQILKMIIDELPSSVYLVQGQDARLLLANRANAAVWGIQWPVGQPIAEFFEQNHIRVFDVSGRLLETEEWATFRALNKGEVVRQQEQVIRQVGDILLPVLVNAVPLHIASSFDTIASPAALVVHQDVTALKESESLKDEFIGIAAHELKSPLAVLRGSAQTLLVQTERGHGQPLADWQIETLRDIDISTERMSNLIEELLDVSRLQAGRLEIQAEACDLITLLERMVKQFQVATKTHQLIFTTALSSLIVHVDVPRVEQIFSNLIFNATKYSPGRDHVDIEVCETHSNGRHEALVSVRDYGIGIPRDQQAYVFRRFARADNALAYSGAGLGLFLCRELIEQHNGCIWFDSVEGEGTTFYFTLPLYSE
jgi:signal transduction histidine kinase